MIARKLVAEGLGTAFLLLGVVGSGIMADALTDDVALALLGNAVATGCILFGIITTLGPISGAHFNPAVTLYFMARKEISAPDALAYIGVQIVAAVLGVWIAHVIFDLTLFQTSTTAHRTGAAQWISESVATFGLLFIIVGGLRARPEAIPALVGFYITGAYFFTASTSFANPAVTIARTLSDTFAGILPAHAPMFIVMQLVGLGLSLAVLPWLFASDE